MAHPGANFGRWRVERITRTGSTNADVMRRAEAGAADGLVLVTDHQSAGRGRLDRRWDAPAGSNLLVSVLFRPKLPPPLWHRHMSAVAVAAADACVTAGVAARIKWPNDLLVGTEKLAGMLAESSLDASGEPAVVVGLGLNLGWPAHGELAGATSLAAHGATIDRDGLLDAILAGIDETAPELPERYADRCSSIGREVRVELPDGSNVVGVARTVDDQGCLVVETSDGTLRSFSVGDVVHARPLTH